MPSLLIPLEEVFEANYALWWSPDSTHLAYLRFDETAVPEYYLSFYTTSNSSYPEEVSIRYPKVNAKLTKWGSYWLSEQVFE